jgi:hypothetical protein
MFSDNPLRRPDDRERPLTLGILALAAVLATGLRLLPHVHGLAFLFNFAAVGALGLYGGARLRSWQAFVVPLAVMAVSDVILWQVVGYPPFNLVVFGSFLVYVLLGKTLVGRSESPWRIGGAALLGSLQFFLITNLAVFLGSLVDPATIPDGAAWTQMAVPGKDWLVNRYAASPAGLLACYTLALPFAWKTVLSDLVFTGLFFGLHAWLARTHFRREGTAGAALSSAEKGL